MQRYDKKIAAGVVALLLTAVLFWTLGRHSVIPNAESGLPDSLVTAMVEDAQPQGKDVQERRRGDIRPRVRYRPAPSRPTQIAGITVPSGTPMSITVHQDLSSKSSVGQSWSGAVAEPVYANGRIAIPAGSTVSGTVSVADPAQRGDRAKLRLALSRVEVNGRSYSLSGRSELLTAGSPRARNVGAIAGGTAAGALLGKAIGGSTKSTVVGGVVGGAAATAAVAASKGYQVGVDAGDELSFTTTRSVTLRG
jgi:hypothetical protein